MRLLASTDFALRMLMLLAREPSGQPISVETLARRLGGLSRHHLHKIVQNLTSMGVTETTRGAGGGVSLAKAPDSIRLGTLVHRLEDDQALVECFQPETCACTLVPECQLKGMLRDAQACFYESLNRKTLADCLPERPRRRGAKTSRLSTDSRHAWRGPRASQAAAKPGYGLPRE